MEGEAKTQGVLLLFLSVCMRMERVRGEVPSIPINLSIGTNERKNTSYSFFCFDRVKREKGESERERMFALQLDVYLTSVCSNIELHQLDLTRRYR